jgi:hypothetical protein
VQTANAIKEVWLQDNSQESFLQNNNGIKKLMIISEVETGACIIILPIK